MCCSLQTLIALAMASALLAGAPAPPVRRVRRTRDGSVYVFEPDSGGWRLESSPAPEVQDGPLPALAWAQFNVSFDGSFRIDGKPLMLAPGQGLRPKDEQQDGDTGRTIWDGAVAMAKALETCRWLVEGRRVLELGAGRGVVSLAAAKLGARKMVATDLSYALRELRQAAQTHNDQCPVGADRSSEEGFVEVAELDWLRTGAFFDSRPADEGFDVLLGADVIWLMELVQPLVAALLSLCKRYAGAEVLIVHQLRAANVEQAFLDAMAESGFEMKWELAGIGAQPGGNAPPSYSDSGLGGPSGKSSTASPNIRDGVSDERPIVSWHPDFTPDARMSFWCFRLREAHP